MTDSICQYYTDEYLKNFSFRLGYCDNIIPDTCIALNSKEEAIEYRNSMLPSRGWLRHEPILIPEIYESRYGREEMDYILSLWDIQYRSKKEDRLAVVNCIGVFADEYSKEPYIILPLSTRYHVQPKKMLRSTCTELVLPRHEMRMLLEGSRLLCEIHKVNMKYDDIREEKVCPECNQGNRP